MSNKWAVFYFVVHSFQRYILYKISALKHYVRIYAPVKNDEKVKIWTWFCWWCDIIIIFFSIDATTVTKVQQIEVLQKQKKCIGKSISFIPPKNSIAFFFHSLVEI
jgi:hypothetical protein